MYQKTITDYHLYQKRLVYRKLRDYHELPTVSRDSMYDQLYEETIWTNRPDNRPGVYIFLFSLGFGKTNEGKRKRGKEKGKGKMEKGKWKREEGREKRDEGREKEEVKRGKREGKGKKVGR